MSTQTKPAARLDASLLLARKGEAQPAVHATSQNNPAMAWGGGQHPDDFKVAQPAHQPTPRPAPAPSPAHHQSNTVSPRAGAFLTAQAKQRQAREQVAMSLRIDDETYLRLKYLAQKTGRSTQQVFAEALEKHLLRNGLPQSRKVVLRPLDA